MTATHGGERQDALKAHVYPASMPAGEGRGDEFLFFPLHGLILTFSHLITCQSSFHGLIQCFNLYEKDNLKIVRIFTVSSTFCIMPNFGICRLVTQLCSMPLT